MKNSKATDTNGTKVAVDVQDLTSEVVLDKLLSVTHAEVFKTARGRKAILVGQAALLQLKRELSLNLEEGPDGTEILRG